jgi:hypothetical protein
MSEDGGCWVLVYEFSCADRVQINFGDLSPYVNFDIMVALSVAYLDLESAVLHCIPKDIKERSLLKATHS